MVEITDRESAKAWLETQPHQRQVWMATRSAARVFPMLASDADPFQFERHVFLTGRAMLISGAASTWPAPDMSALKTAAAYADTAAANAAYAATATTAAANAAAKAASAAAANDADTAASAAAFGAASAASAAIWQQFSADADVREGWPPLWQGAEVPSLIARAYEDLKQRLGHDRRIWGFWLDWYDGLLTGTPKPWPLILKLALELTIDDWETGPAHIADRIRDIEADFHANAPLDPERLKERVRELLRDRVQTADMAEGAGNLIEKAIREYKDTAPANGLPDGLEPLEALPQQFWQIAAVVKMDAAPTEREAALEEEIKKLHARIAELEREAAKAQSIGAKFVETWTQGMAKTLSDKWFLGGLGMGAAFFFGVDPMDLKLANVKGYINDLMNAVPDTSPPRELPPTDEA